jgi:integrase
LELNPHLIRHAIAKIVIDRDPGAYLSISRVLGHASLSTTLGHYLGTETKAAARHIDQLLIEAKEEFSAKPRRRRNNLTDKNPANKRKKED